jgi:hypothetical protein
MTNDECVRTQRWAVPAEAAKGDLIAAGRLPRPYGGKRDTIYLPAQERLISFSLPGLARECVIDTDRTPPRAS